METSQSRREWGDTLKILKEKNCQPRLPYLVKLFSTNRGTKTLLTDKS